MKKELEQKLFNDFPKLFRQKDLDKMQTCMCWGIECPDEWFDVIYKACKLIQTMIDNNQHLSDKYPQIEFTQVKEKWGAYVCTILPTQIGWMGCWIWPMPWCMMRG